MYDHQDLCVGRCAKRVFLLLLYRFTVTYSELSG